MPALLPARPRAPAARWRRDPLPVPARSAPAEAAAPPQRPALAGGRNAAALQQPRRALTWRPLRQAEPAAAAASPAGRPGRSARAAAARAERQPQRATRGAQRAAKPPPPPPRRSVAAATQASTPAAGPRRGREPRPAREAAPCDRAASGTARAASRLGGRLRRRRELAAPWNRLGTGPAPQDLQRRGKARDLCLWRRRAATRRGGRAPNVSRWWHASAIARCVTLRATHAQPRC